MTAKKPGVVRFPCPFCGLKCAAGPDIDAAYGFLAEVDPAPPAVLHEEPVCEAWTELDSADFLRAAGQGGSS